MAVGSPNLYFSRDTKVYMVQTSGAGTIWELPVLNGFTFTQATNTSEITLAEMSDSTGASRRARQMFNDSLAPAEWSFDTYVRPWADPITGTVLRMRSIEEPLWANFLSNAVYTAATPAWAPAGTVVYGAASTDYTLANSNKTTIGSFDLYFVLGAGKSATTNYAVDEVTAIYKIVNCSINEVSITFDIDGISTLSWSGMGGTLREVTLFDASTAITTAVASSNTFIRNRLTQLAVTSSVSGSSKTYAITLTGGTITMSNNLTYLTPEVLGRVNSPLGHVTGTRSIGGSFTCYLDEKTLGSMELFEDLSLATSTIQNKFALDFYIGGKAAGDLPISPGLQFKIPTAHLTIPAIDTADVVAVSVDFAALPTSMDVTNEVTAIRYVGPQPV